MIHRLIAQLQRHRTFQQWLFILTTYELGKRGWVRRADIVQAADFNGNTIKKLVNELMLRGDIQQRKVPEQGEPGGGHMEVRLNDIALTDLQVAFNLARTAASQPVAA